MAHGHRGYIIMDEMIVESNNAMVESIKKCIYDVRGMKVMLDCDLARLFGVETKVLNQAVKRNINRFPSDFMFRWTEAEWDEIDYNLQIYSMRSQIVTASPNRRNKSNPPFAFTEHGAVMLAAVLRSPCAVQMSVMVTRAFIAMRRAISTMLSVDLKVEQISHRVDQLNAYIEEILHDQNEINEQHEMADNEISIQIEVLNDALDQLRAQSSIPRKRIGFKQRSEAEEEPDE